MMLGGGDRNSGFVLKTMSECHVDSADEHAPQQGTLFLARPLRSPGYNAVIDRISKSEEGQNPPCARAWTPRGGDRLILRV